MYGHGGDFLGFFSEMQGYPTTPKKRCGRLSSRAAERFAPRPERHFDSKPYPALQ
jgi:hypothetical protein